MRKISLASIACVTFLLMTQVALAIPGPVPITDKDNNPIVPEFVGLTDADASDTTTLIPYLIGVLEFLVTAITILFLVFAGYLFVTAAGKEEQLTKAKHAIMYSSIGLLIITFSRVITEVFFKYGRGATPDTLETAIDTTLGNQTITTIINFAQLLLGSVAVLFIVVAGYQFIVARGQEEQLTKAKHSILYSTIGLMAVVMSEAIVRTFFNVEDFGDTPQGNFQLGVLTVISITNFILAFVGVIAILMLVVAGFQYITARGQEEQTNKAKQSLLYAAIGLIVVVFAYSIVSIVIGGNV